LTKALPGHGKAHVTRTTEVIRVERATARLEARPDGRRIYRLTADPHTTTYRVVVRPDGDPGVCIFERRDLSSPQLFDLPVLLGVYDVAAKGEHVAILWAGARVTADVFRREVQDTYVSVASDSLVPQDAGRRAHGGRLEWADELLAIVDVGGDEETWRVNLPMLGVAPGP
jgi:hypothetical protein